MALVSPKGAKLIRYANQAEYEIMWNRLFCSRYIHQLNQKGLLPIQQPFIVMSLPIQQPIVLQSIQLPINQKAPSPIQHLFIMMTLRIPQLCVMQPIQPPIKLEGIIADTAPLLSYRCRYSNCLFCSRYSYQLNWKELPIQQSLLSHRCRYSSRVLCSRYSHQLKLEGIADAAILIVTSLPIQQPCVMQPIQPPATLDGIVADTAPLLSHRCRYSN